MVHFVLGQSVAWKNDYCAFLKRTENDVLADRIADMAYKSTDSPELRSEICKELCNGNISKYLNHVSTMLVGNEMDQELLQLSSDMNILCRVMEHQNKPEEQL